LYELGARVDTKEVWRQVFTAGGIGERKSDALKSS
jgi:hypothetical protein